MIQPVALPSAAVAALLLVAGTPVWAAFVSADQATTNMGQQGSAFGDAYAIGHLSDGSCLTDPGSLQSSCSPDEFDGFNGYTWVSSDQTTGFIDFAFGGALEFVGASIWNLNTGAGSNASLNVQDIALFGSLDGSGFLPLTFSVNDGASGSIGTLTQVPNNSTSPTSPDSIAFDPIILDAIRLQIISNFGGRAVGLSEVAFDATAPFPTPTPAPATLLLLAPALLWLGQRRDGHSG